MPRERIHPRANGDSLTGWPMTAAQGEVTVLHGQHLLRPGSIQLAELEAVQYGMEKDNSVRLQFKGTTPEPEAGRILIERVRSGELDLAVVPLAAMANVVPLFRIFEIPFLFRDPGHMRSTLSRLDENDGLPAKDRLHAAGLEGVGWLSGEPLIIASHQPLLEPGDLRGLKVARASSIEFGEPSATELLGRKLGAAPVRLPRATSTKELLHGSVDAIEIELSELGELEAEQIFVSETNHLYGGYIIVANLARWATLPETVRVQITEKFRFANDSSHKAIREKTDHTRQKLANQEGVTLIPVASSMGYEWRDATRSESLTAEAGNSTVGYVEFLGSGGESFFSTRVSTRNITWNAWFERGPETSPKDVSVLEVNDVYRFNLDLARYAYSTLSADLSTSLMSLLGDKGERTLLLHPVLLGDELMVAPGKSFQPSEITVKLERSRVDPHDQAVVDQFQKNQIPTRTLSQAVNLVALQVGISRPRNPAVRRLLSRCGTRHVLCRSIISCSRYLFIGEGKGLGGAGGRRYPRTGLVPRLRP